MDSFGTIKQSEARSLLRLTHELHELASAPVFCKEHLLRSLCDMVRAQVGCCCLVRDVLPGKQWRFLSMVDLGWSSPSQRAVAHAWIEGDLRRDPMEAITPRRQRPLTRTRREVVDDGRWYGSPNVVEVRKACGVDECLYSLAPLPRPGWAVVLALHRPWGDRRPFTPHDATIVHLLHSEMAGLYKREVELLRGLSTVDDSLPPRVRQTLQLLLRGASEKQVAAQLDISRHTVHVYVRQLYRHFNVNTRAELMAHLLNGRNGHN